MKNFNLISLTVFSIFFNTLLSAQTSTNRFRGRVSQNETMELAVTRNQENGTAIINGVKQISQNGDKENYFLLDGSYFSSNKVVIPTSLIPYWFISFSEDVPPMMVTGADPITISCQCILATNPMECEVDETQMPCVSCKSEACESCKLLESKGGSGLILKAPRIVFNGVEYNPANAEYYMAIDYASTIRSKISSAKATQIDYYKRDGVAIVKLNENLPVRNDDFYNFYALDGLSFNGNTVVVPNDGKKYWYVSFNPQETNPVIYMATGGTLTVDCLCSGSTGTGTCTTKFDGKCFHCCNETCGGECKLNTTKGDNKPGIMIQAESVYYKGVHYKME